MMEIKGTEPQHQKTYHRIVRIHAVWLWLGAYSIAKYAKIIRPDNEDTAWAVSLTSVWNLHAHITRHIKQMGVVDHIKHWTVRQTYTSASPRSFLCTDKYKALNDYVREHCWSCSDWMYRLIRASAVHICLPYVLGQLPHRHQMCCHCMSLHVCPRDFIYLFFFLFIYLFIYLFYLFFLIAARPMFRKETVLLVFACSVLMVVPLL